MDLHLPVDKNKSYADMTREEKLRYDHQQMHEKHRGHESMHLEMMLVLVVTLVVAQLLLVHWKKRHYRSYSLVTLLALWLIPVGISLHNFWWRYCICWLLFSASCGIVMLKAAQRPIEGTTPRLVFKWFNFVYKLTYVLGIVGYALILCVFFGINMLFGHLPPVWMDPASLLIFYGTYFGVLGRDLSEICADKMAATIGYYKPKGIPTRHLEENVCAVCGNHIDVQQRSGSNAAEDGTDADTESLVVEASYRLPCNHVFHEYCIRGWCIIGKKQTCPYCKEKVDLQRLFKNPWEKPHMLYGQLLDWIRYMVAWMPVILCIVQMFNMFLGLESLFE